MTRLKICSLLLSLLLLAACKNDPLDGRNDPKGDAWSLTFHGPSYMQGWVEGTAVEDINDRTITKPGTGSIGSGDPGLDQEYARGWPGLAGNYYPMTGADMPKRVFVGTVRFFVCGPVTVCREAGRVFYQVGLINRSPYSIAN